MQEIVSNRLLSPVPRRKVLIPDLQRGRGLGNFHKRNLNPEGVWQLRSSRASTPSDYVGNGVGASGRISTDLGTREDMIIAEIVFPIMLEPWCGERQNSQFTVNKVTLCTLFCWLKGIYLFYNNCIVSTVLYKTH